MNNTIKIKCNLGTTNPAAGLAMQVWIDSEKIFDQPVVETTPIEFDLTEDEANHSLRFVMSNKMSGHTQIDSNGNIVADSRLTVSDLEFDEIPLGQIVIDKAVYTHNFNGTAEETQSTFYGEIGCNGTVELKFTTPVYLWLLENY
jgi:hypothetical protein